MDEFRACLKTKRAIIDLWSKAGEEIRDCKDDLQRPYLVGKWEGLQAAFYAVNDVFDEYLKEGKE